MVRENNLRKRVIIISIILMACIFAGCVDDGEENEVREYPEWANYTVERTITISPRNPAAPMSYVVDIPTPRDIPLDDPQLQDVRSIVADPDTTTPQYPDYEWMFWEAENVTGTQSFTIQYSIRTESVIWTGDPSESGTEEDIPVWLRERYGNRTREEWRILPQHPNIIEESEQLTANKVSVYDKLYAIFDWMNTHIEYETQRRGSPRFCNETYVNRRGDCDDQSVLFVALARAAGLPTWLEFGPLYNRMEDSWGGHAWIRAYIPDISGGGHVYNIDIVNDHFLFRDSLRFTEWESDGDGEHLEDYYNYHGNNFEYSEIYTTITMETSPETIRR